MVGGGLNQWEGIEKIQNKLKNQELSGDKTITDGVKYLSSVIMDMRNDKQLNVLTHARVNFSQSETSSLLRGVS